MAVYDYEAILEVRRREKEERKRVREERKREKERRKMERAKRRADKILGRKLLSKCNNDSELKKLEQLKKNQPSEEVTVSDVLASLEDEKTEKAECIIENVKEEKEEEEEKNESAIANVEKSANEGEEEEEAEEEDEHEEEEDEEGEEEEEEEEEEDEDKQSSRLAQSDDVATAAESEEAVQPEVDAREWPSLPPAPLKGILVCPGFG